MGSCVLQSKVLCKAQYHCRSQGAWFREHSNPWISYWSGLRLLFTSSKPVWSSLWLLHNVPHSLYVPCANQYCRIIFSPLLPCVHTRVHMQVFSPFLFSCRGEWDLKPHLPFPNHVLMWDEELRGGKSYSSLCNHPLGYQSAGQAGRVKSGHCVISVTSLWISKLAKLSPNFLTNIFYGHVCRRTGTTPSFSLKKPPPLWLLFGSVAGRLCRQRCRRGNKTVLRQQLSQQRGKTGPSLWDPDLRNVLLVPVGNQMSKYFC